ncbi:MAG: hypothetical protein KDJ25_04985 [Rhodoblastus sp.]|nr:hypothetical protein [Rhodoblastus sp.]
MITSIAAALSSIKTIKDMAEAAVTLHDAQATQEQRLKFQQVILDAQNALFSANEERSTLIDEIASLKKKIAEFENWKADAERYELKPADGSDVLTYQLKATMEHGEPAHHLCPNCFQQRQKSILVKEQTSVGRRTLLVCKRCNSEYMTQGVRHN